ncbi:MAG: metalloregulator ArsR/SmtB family transcription factor [Chloroflexi bacterium]|nr:metalloregulator ArsR/SmtB family transcription factor [Chloroflexota bacterium]MCI0646966.1 metalloregulator ArsR/SmtB family transcription factor [Chloroflexota bacterium]MCI0729275.1 metalloregulator ArsR/SmtB family transcription factor [Chloroflexota bacterium]
MQKLLVADKPPDFLKLLAHDLRWQLLKTLAASDYRVNELVQLVGQPQNLVSYHLGRLRQQQLVRERRSSANGRDIYYSLDLDRVRALYLASGKALHPVIGSPERDPRPKMEQVSLRPMRVLFLCTHNSARSQMAEGLLRHLGGDRVEVFSAGSEPAAVHPDAIRAMARLNIDISRQTSKHLDTFVGQTFDYIITVCDRVREVCPVFPDDPERIHWTFPDPVTIEGNKARFRAFEETARLLTNRIHHLLIVIDRRRAG